jgi:hypothetical protein
MWKSSGRIAGWLFIGLVGFVVLWNIQRKYVDIMVPVFLGGGSGEALEHSWDANPWSRVSASGTWVIENGHIANPLQISDLTCRRDEERCTSKTAYLFEGRMLAQREDRYKIVRWASDTVIFADDDVPCFSLTYTISRATKQIVGIRSPKAAAFNTCQGVGQEPMRLVLTDSTKVWLKLQQEVRSSTNPILWSATAVWGFFFLSRIFRRRVMSTAGAAAPA